MSDFLILVGFVLALVFAFKYKGHWPSAKRDITRLQKMGQTRMQPHVAKVKQDPKKFILRWVLPALLLLAVFVGFLVLASPKDVELEWGRNEIPDNCGDLVIVYVLLEHTDLQDERIEITEEEVGETITLVSPKNIDRIEKCGIPYPVNQ